MEDFRKYLLIPLALTVASWAATGYLKLPIGPRVTFVISLALVAILAGLPFRKPSQDTAPQKPISRWRRQSTWLTAGIVICSLAAFFSGMIGYRQSPKATQSINQSTANSLPSGPQPGPANSDPLVK